MSLASRLDEISVDMDFPQGRGKKKALCELLGLSSGRLSQIYAAAINGDHSVKLSEESLRKLISAGYNPEWVQTGNGLKRASLAVAEEKISPEMRENLRALMEASDENPNSLAAKSGVPQPTIFRILSGESLEPRRSNLEKLAAALGVSIEDIYARTPLDSATSGSNSHAIQFKQENLPNTEPGPDLQGALVPLISWVQAGSWTAVVDNLQPGQAYSWLACPVAHGPHTFVLRVRGESMYNPQGRPSFADGDLIYVDPEREAVHGSLVVVRLDGSMEATFKRLCIEGDQKFLRPLNTSWPDQYIPINGNATICGVVIFKGETI